METETRLWQLSKAFHAKDSVEFGRTIDTNLQSENLGLLIISTPAMSKLAKTPSVS